ncbi:Uncharacterised protein r2_g4280 [Pycnogonum litorale]
MDICTCFISALFLFLSVSSSNLDTRGGQCFFNGLQADCLLKVHDVGVQVRVTINQCHIPIDVVYEIDVSCNLCAINV